EEDAASLEEDAEDDEDDDAEDAEDDAEVDAAVADNACDNGVPEGEMLTADDAFDDETAAPSFAAPQAVLKSITETAAIANNLHLCCI
nr:hypothetical protein [Lachnospiraceae bacterium]